MKMNTREVPTFVQSFAVGEKRELEEQGTQKICSTHNASHLIGEKERGKGGEEWEIDRCDTLKQPITDLEAAPTHDSVMNYLILCLISHITHICFAWCI